MKIYIFERYGRQPPHLKVAKGGKSRLEECFTVTLDHETRVHGELGEINQSEASQVLQFMQLNKQLLDSYWQQDPFFSTMDMLQQIRSVQTGAE